MSQALLTKSTPTEVPPLKKSTPILFNLREIPPELKLLDLTDTGAPTDIPPREIWDMDYDS